MSVEDSHLGPVKKEMHDMQNYNLWNSTARTDAMDEIDAVIELVGGTAWEEADLDEISTKK